MTTWLNTSPREFRTIDGLSIRFAENEERDDHALLLGPWPESPPVLIIAGKRDTAVPPDNPEFLHQRLPHSKLDMIDVGHFTWEDGADEYAALVTAWAGEYATARSGAAP